MYILLAVLSIAPKQLRCSVASVREMDGSSCSDDPLAVFLTEGCEEVYPGAVAAVGRSSGIDRAVAVGQRDETDQMTRSTLFDVASLTKPVVTATVALSLMECGRVAFSDEVRRYVPTVGSSVGDVRLVELLTHSSGLQPYAFSEAWNSREDVFAGLDDGILASQPGTQYEYSCLNFVYAAEMLRRATDRSLGELAADFVFEPADMTESHLGPVDASNVAATYDHTYRDRVLSGEIHDPLGWVMDGESGNAGLFTTVEDLASFAQQYLSGDALLSPATIDRLQNDWLPELDDRHSLGWRLGDGTYPSPNWSLSGLGHTGYTGTSMWLDHERDRFAILLTNQVYDGKETGLIRFRERFHAMVAAGRFD